MCIFACSYLDKTGKINIGVIKVVIKQLGVPKIFDSTLSFYFHKLLPGDLDASDRDFEIECICAKTKHTIGLW